MEALKTKQSISLEDIGHFRRLFEQERKNLLYTQHIINESFHVPVEDLADATDLTSSELEASMRIRLRNREALYLKKIDEALDRIAENTFGTCKSCEESIDLRRLKARPTATSCIQCKEEEELKENQHADGRRPKSLGPNLSLV